MRGYHVDILPAMCADATTSSVLELQYSLSLGGQTVDNVSVCTLLRGRAIRAIATHHL